MAALVKLTHTYATHDIPLECDIYEAPNCPGDTPVFLFFHSGGLVGGSRLCIPPWLVQTCLRKKWLLVSASYRLLPQVDGKGLLADVKAVYDFVRWDKGQERRVIVGGASAGGFPAMLAAHHLQPAPLAILSITSIPTFQHSFFNSSTLLTPEPLKESEMKQFIDEPVSVGTTTPDDPTIFHVDSILPSGAKNPDFVRPKVANEAEISEDLPRHCLYDYFLYQNAYPSLVGEADEGFEWARREAGSSKLANWPLTVIIQGDDDPDVHVDVCRHVAECLGDRARFCLAKGQPHLFEATNFIEDEGVGMDAVRKAVQELEGAVTAALAK